MNEHEQIERLKLQERMMRECKDWTPRYQRARRFTAAVMGLMRDFIPEDRYCRRRIEEHLMETSFFSNAEIVEVPPELDVLDKLALEKRMLDKAMEPITLASEMSAKGNS